MMKNVFLIVIVLELAIGQVSGYIWEPRDERCTGSVMRMLVSEFEEDLNRMNN